MHHIGRAQDDFAHLTDGKLVLARRHVDDAIFNVGHRHADAGQAVLAHNRVGVIAGGNSLKP